MEFLKTLLSTTVSKVTAGIILSLVTALGGSLAINKFQYTENSKLSSEITSLSNYKVQADRLISDLQYEISTKPAQYIEVVREVDKELCEGLGLVDAINNLPAKINLQSSKSNTTEAPHEQNDYVDIDGLLPPELTRLLK